MSKYDLIDPSVLLGIDPAVPGSERTALIVLNMGIVIKECTDGLRCSPDSFWIRRGGFLIYKPGRDRKQVESKIVNPKQLPEPKK